MTTEKSTGAREELVSFGEQNLLLGFLTIPSCDGKAPAVIAAHGFAGTKSQRKFVEMGRIFAEKGIAFLRFDFSGCGDSDGNPADISIGKWASDFSFAYDFLCARKEIDASRIGFLGYSFVSNNEELALKTEDQCQKKISAGGLQPVTLSELFSQ